MLFVVVVNKVEKRFSFVDCINICCIQVVELYGSDVVIIGKESCTKFRNAIPAEERILGVAGLFNTGTNYHDPLHVQ